MDDERRTHGAVIVVADGEEVGERLAAALSQAGFEVLGTAGDLGAIAEPVMMRAAAVIASVRGEHGAWTAGRVLNELRDVPVVLLTDTAIPEDALAERRLGWAVLPLETAFPLIATVLEAVLAGLTVAPPDIRAATQSPLGGVETTVDTAIGEFTETLTRREREVLTLLADGLTNRLIAERLGISEHTAKFHVSTVYAKLGAANRAEAVAIGWQRGLIAL